MKKHTLLAFALVLSALAGTAQSALIVNTYSGAGLSGGVAGVQNAINTQAPTYSTTTSVINYWDGSGSNGNYGGDSPFPGGLVDNFGLDIKGFVNVTVAGSYEFRSLADDGVQLKIDGNTLFSDSGYHPQEYRSGTIVLTTGMHALDFIFFEGGGGATVELESRLGNGAFSLIGSANGLQTVPEPGSIALLGLGLFGAVAARRKSKKK
jgi:hypothetical protein